MKREPLEAILIAGRDYADSQLQRAAEGLTPKGPVFLAVVVLDAASAYLRLWGPQPDELQAADSEPPPERIDIDKPESVELNQGIVDYLVGEWGPWQMKAGHRDAASL